MPYESFDWSLVIGQMVAGFVSVGLYAHRKKNRSFLAWGLFGAVASVIALIALAMQSKLCATCQADLPRGCKDDHCESCASAADAALEAEIAAVAEVDAARA